MGTQIHKHNRRGTCPLLLSADFCVSGLCQVPLATRCTRATRYAGYTVVILVCYPVNRVAGELEHPFCQVMNVI